MSHTVTIDIKMKNKEALVKAAESMNAEILGEGTHRLFGSSHQGLGIKLPKWNFPIVVDESGTAFYDNYNGAWGNPADVARLADGYAQAVVEQECENLGWYHERNEATGEVIVHHPAGGTITVGKGGVLDAQGFHGTSCADATLKLEQAMGLRLGESIKPEMNETQIVQREIA
jgi:hypothetical protein